MSTLSRPAARASRRPPIQIAEGDYDRIADLALAMKRRMPELSAQVLAEIDRARLRPDDRLPAGIVRLGSEVGFADDSGGTVRRIRLVMPSEADMDSGCVSVMSPIGAGLIGMSEGQEISWPRPNGQARVLRILAVRQPVPSAPQD
jgi:regulator of nucleoside diphosphate kinase